MNGLSAIVETEFSKGILATSWFVFISRDKKTVKLIYWRGSGLCLWQYRLEQESFELGKPRYLLSKNISFSELRKFLDGYNIFAGEKHKRLSVKRMS